MNKIQQSYIYKFNTDRLKNNDYNITIDIQQARKNDELISIGESQMLKSLRVITNHQLDKKNIENLFLEKRKIKNRTPSYENMQKLLEIEKEIDRILFVPEIISIVVKNIKHYENIIKNGLFINNRSFVRLMCSAGQARRNNVLMIDKEYELLLKNVLNNGRSDIEISPAKFNAYFALSSSTSLEVETPYFCVIPDYKVVRKELVDFITESPDGKDTIITQEKDIEFNLFDGQGIVSPRQAKVWADSLGIDYIPSAFIVRSNFIKGLVAVVDFVEFSDRIGKHIIQDIYGNSVNIRDMDVILTESQFKLYQGFNSTQEYIAKSKSNQLSWWISRYSPKEENKYTSLNYQFLQVLNLSQDQIKALCDTTVEYFNSTIKDDIAYTLLYLLGNKSQFEFDNKIFEKITDNVAKALLLNNKLIDDPYIHNHIANSLKKRIKDSYIGKILVEGCYTFMISDPYAFLEYAFGLPIQGLLKRNENYNSYWINKGESKIAAMRSPLTWRSEVDVIDLKTNSEIEYWYKYLNNCIIFNVHGCDMALLGGADFDGDIVCLTNQKEIIDGAYGGLPIFYDTQNTPKQKIKEDELYKYDIKGFNSKVGFLTNCGTTMYAMLPMYNPNSLEHQEIIRRLKQSRKEQGAIIDSTKGLVIRPIPSYWTNWTKVLESFSPEEKEFAEFNNKILIDKRPLFMQFLYSNYYKKNKQHQYNYNLYSISNFGQEIESLLNKSQSELSDEQKIFIDKYYRFSPLLDTDCTVNLISKYMQEKTKDLFKTSQKLSLESTLDILSDNSLFIDEEKLNKLHILYKKYKKGKRNLISVEEGGGEERYKTLEQYNKAIRKEAYAISPNIKELANLAIKICYEMYPSDNKTFAWNVFGEGIIENIKKNKQEDVRMPFIDENGDIYYLGYRYSMKTIDVEDDIYDLL